jgi:hypothetical protein
MDHSSLLESAVLDAGRSWLSPDRRQNAVNPEAVQVGIAIDQQWNAADRYAAEISRSMIAI